MYEMAPMKPTPISPQTTLVVREGVEISKCKQTKTNTERHREKTQKEASSLAIINEHAQIFSSSDVVWGVTAKKISIYAVSMALSLCIHLKILHTPMTPHSLDN
jgi:hypothetical protein